LPIITSTMSDSQRASAAVTTNIDAYDNLGNPHRVTLTIWHTGVNQWTASASMSDVDGNITVDVPGAAGTNQHNPNNRMNLTFHLMARSSQHQMMPLQTLSIPER
jgi:hypothetical protein